MIAVRLSLCLFFALAVPNLAIADDAPEPGVRYKVTGVASDDTLNVRAQPGTDADIIGAIGPDAGNVIVTGSSWKVGQSTWWELPFPGADRGLGWVNGRFLTRQTDSAAEDTNYPLDCGGTEPFWSLTVQGDRAQFKLWIEEEEQTLDASRWMAARGMRGWFVVRLAETETTGGGGLLTVRSADQAFCSDDMSDTDYPFFATVILPDDQVFGGCCSRGAP
ncbi:MAG: hypothetical protein GY798_18085 [Hyphomicrobiales bacterium]|nr:hypothetical protein [Hyphomicrobiales bacterium]